MIRPPSARRLTPDQVQWHAAWRGQVVVVTDVAEALAALGIEHRGAIGGDWQHIGDVAKRMIGDSE